MIYLYDNSYNKNYDKGIHWNSVKFKWPKRKFIISNRDKNFKSFKSYFKLKIKINFFSKAIILK